MGEMILYIEISEYTTKLKLTNEFSKIAGLTKPEKSCVFVY